MRRHDFVCFLLLPIASAGVITSPSVEAATCTASSTGVYFGEYNPVQRSPNESSGALLISCSRSGLDALPLTVSYGIDISRGSSSSFLPRTLKSGAYVLNYNLYRDLPRSDIWGDGTSGTSMVSGSMVLPANSGAASMSHTIYGRISSGQNVGVGTYVDTIVVTITY
jgi:spore coat protein U-like protein